MFAKLSHKRIHTLLRSLVAGIVWLAWLWLSATTSAQERTPLDVMVILDESGSMSTNDPSLERYAATQLITRLMGTNDTLSVLPFHTERIEGYGINSFRKTDGTYDFRDIPSIRREGGGGTNMRSAFEGALQRFSSLPITNRRRALVFLTDGMPDDSSGLVQLVRRLAEDQKVRMYFVGLGSMVNVGLLEALAKTAGTLRVYSVQRAEDLPDTFGEIFSDFSAREVAITNLRPGQTFALGPSAKNLRITMAKAGGNPTLRLQAPDGRMVSVTALPRTIGGQVTRVASLHVPSPVRGTYKIQSVDGAAQATYEPNFRVVLLSPRDGDRVGQNAELPIRARVETDDRQPIAEPAKVSVSAQNGNLNLRVDLTRSGAEFSGRIPDVGAPGRLVLKATTSRELDDGSIELGVPANAQLEVLVRPIVSITFPNTSRFQTRPGQPIAIRGVRVKTNAHGAYVVGLRLTGPNGTELRVKSLAAQTSDQPVTIEVDTKGLEPGEYEFSITPSLIQGKADFKGPTYEAQFRVLSWWDLWGWLVLAILGLLVLIVCLVLAYMAVWWVQYQRWRRRVDRKLRSIKVRVEGSDEVFRLGDVSGLVQSITLGGAGSSIDVSSGTGDGGFSKPVLRIECPRPRRPSLRFPTRLYLVRQDPDVQILNTDETPLGRVSIKEPNQIIAVSPEVPGGLLMEIEP